jgi:hypothetical protein
VKKPFTAPERDFFGKVIEGVEKGSIHSSTSGSLDRLTVNSCRALQNWPESNFPIQFSWAANTKRAPPTWFDPIEMLIQDDGYDGGHPGGGPPAEKAYSKNDEASTKRQLRGGKY